MRKQFFALLANYLIPFLKNSMLLPKRPKLGQNEVVTGIRIFKFLFYTFLKFVRFAILKILQPIKTYYIFLKWFNMRV